MLPSRGSVRAPRGTAIHSSRGSRGQETTSRGAPNSSSKSFMNMPPSGPKAMRDKSNIYHGNYRGKNFYKKRKFSTSFQIGSSDPGTSNPYENDQHENAAKRSRRDEQNSSFDRGGSRGRGNRGNHRGSGRGGFTNKQVRFAEPTTHEKKVDSFSRTPSPLNHNPFLTNSSTTDSSFQTAAAMANPFGAPSGAPAPPAKNPFGTPVNPFATTSQTATGLFGAPSGTQPANPFQTTTTAFGAPSNGYNPFLQGPKDTKSTPNSVTSSSFAQPSSRLFGSPSATNGTANSSSTPSPFGQPTSNPFGPSSTSNGMSTGLFGAPSGSKPNPFAQPSNSFGSLGNQSSASTTNGTSTIFSVKETSNGATGAANDRKPNRFSQPSNAFGSFGAQSSTTNTNGGTSRAITSGIATGIFGTNNNSKSGSTPLSSKSVGSFASQNFGTMNGNTSKVLTDGIATAQKSIDSFKTLETSESLAAKVDQILKREGIRKPEWPSVDFKRNPGLWEAYTKDYREFRNKMRVSLTRAGLIDDPDVPKRLEDAIVFKGTCNDMCPELEAAERIVERRYDQFEKDYLDDGSFSAIANPSKMIKKLARSAAGQEAPLPIDVRTVTALKATLDYLIDEILDKMDLAAVHGFIWDRTRAIRRDFVFHTYLTTEELLDRIYVLETIARFHVIALHQMSRKGVNAPDFVEQQEHEQLGKTLVSLVHAYEDCEVRQVECENEAEFRAYYLLFNRRDPGLQKRAQDWGWKFWGESEEVPLAASLVEACQNTWDTHGPLENPATKGNTQFDITQCAFSKFFTIVEDKSVSYTMACFAETCFNDIRKSIMKTILKAYRRQKDQTKDWTLSRLNTYLRFDDEADILLWGEKHGLHFESGDEEEYLSFDKSMLRDASPEVRQQHSYALVERKRGDHSLPEVIRTTVFDTSDDEEDFVAEDYDDELFVRDDSVLARILPPPVAIQEEIPEEIPEEAPERLTKGVDNTTPSIAQNESTSARDSAPKPASIFDRIGTPKSFGNDFFTSTPKESSTPKEDPPALFTKPPGKGALSVFAQPTKDPSAATQAKPPFSFLSQPSSSSAPPKDLSSTTTSTIEKAPTTLGQQPSFHPPEKIQSLAQPQTETSTRASVPQLPLFPPVASPASMNAPVQSSLFGTKPEGSTATVASMPAAPAIANDQAVEQSSVSPPNPTPPPNKPPKILGVAKWIALGEGGLLDQFTEFHVEKLLFETATMFVAEQQKLAEEEAEAQARIEADQFRYNSLATRYGRQWREAARRLWLKRRGREARQARKEMAESMRASKAAEKANLVEDFRASTSAKRRESRERRESLESLLDETGVLNGVHDPEEKIRAIVQQEIRAVMQLDHNGSSNKRSRSQQSPNSMASSNRHKRGRSDNPLGRSLLSDPSYLNGGSRIHLMSNYDDQDERRRQISGVQTDYFRLKARGITTLQNGAPLANSAVKSIVHQKRSFDGITKPTTPHQAKVQAWAQSVPAKPDQESRGSLPSVEYEAGDMGAMKIGVDALLLKEKSKQKRAMADDDEELFARAKRIREQMDEGAEWFRKQILKRKSRSSS
ncbi:hypothetical protein EG329_002739 [Mollisiaceae sp. DMI_Dod_QoI]|nr:hypothetical protein EG329_002739 [Helotiales sp. DMI_Dod_QoI]